MANKIQLRRDTTANWTRVNPILDDGEPGLEIDTNKVKYGDGNTRWADLDYASGGLSLSYADFQEGVSSPPGNTNVTSLTGYTGTGLSLTSDTWAQLMWVPDTTTVTIDDIDNGPVTYNWAYVDGDGFTVTNGIDGPEQYQWAFGLDGTLSLPNGGHIGPAGVKGDGTMITGGNAQITSLTSYYSSGLYSSCVTANADGTLNITAYNDGGPDPSKQWTFDNGGNLTLPAGGEIHSNAGTGNVTLQASDGSNPRNFVFNTSGSISLPHLAAGGQGAGAFDANNNLLALTSSDTVDFHNFSGMILVNCHNSGCVTLYLCGGGAGHAVSLGNSKGADTGTMAHNNGIAGYTFTATESGDHVFCAIRTRTGA